MKKISIRMKKHYFSCLTLSRRLYLIIFEDEDVEMGSLQNKITQEIFCHLQRNSNKIVEMNFSVSPLEAILPTLH